MKNAKPTPEQILAKSTKVESGCWEWSGSRSAGGYGKIKCDYRTYQISRLLWEGLNNQVLQPGECVLHKCDNPACVNPEHLFIGTKRDNTLDMCAKGRHGYGKLTPDQVRAIRADLRSTRVIAKEFNVACIQISRIKRRISYRWID